jgi:peptidoglycan/LPS O-acetylase OafA/YrhL
VTGRGPAPFVSIGHRLTLDNRPSGFDYLRITLSLLILADHSVLACLGDAAQRELFGGFGRPLMTCVVPMFFALSGFLVASSLARSRSLVTFVGLRALRIVPALAVDTLFCALVLGVALTSLPLRDYLHAVEFRRYFLNIVGDIHYVLPGVFNENPSNVVNSQLWTIPYELECYAVLTVMAIGGLHRRRALFLIATCLVTFGIALYVYYRPVDVVDVWQLVMPSFLVSAAAYLYRDRLEWSFRLLAVALVAMIVLLNQTGALMTIAAFPIAYVTVWLGMLRPRRDPSIRSGDYSYPLYLYSFPIQQAIIVLIPIGAIWWINLLLAVPLSFVFAAASWHLVEKPLQQRRRYLYALEEHQARACAGSSILKSLFSVIARRGG